MSGAIRIATAIVVENAKFLAGNWSLGIGYNTPTVKSQKPIGKVLYEPYMTVTQGHVSTIDGETELSVPIRLFRTVI